MSPYRTPAARPTEPYLTLDERRAVLLGRIDDLNERIDRELRDNPLSVAFEMLRRL